MPMRVSEVERFSQKIIGLGASAVVLAALFGYTLRLEALAPGTGWFLALLFTALVWIAMAGLIVFFVKSWRIASLFAALETLAAWAFLQNPFSAFTLAGTAFLFIFLIIGFVRGRAILENSVHIHFPQVSERIIAVIVTGLIFFVTLYLFGASELSESPVPKSALSFFLHSTDPITTKFIPDLSSSNSFDEALRAVAKARLPADAAPETVDREVIQEKKQIERLTSISVPGETNVIEAMYQIIAAKLALLPPPVKTFTFVSVGILIFGIVKWIAFILDWIAIGVSFLAYQILLAMNFFHISLENEHQEVIVMD